MRGTAHVHRNRRSGRRSVCRGRRCPCEKEHKQREHVWPPALSLKTCPLSSTRSRSSAEHGIDSPNPLPRHQFLWLPSTFRPIPQGRRKGENRPVGLKNRCASPWYFTFLTGTSSSGETWRRRPGWMGTRRFSRPLLRAADRIRAKISANPSRTSFGRRARPPRRRQGYTATRSFGSGQRGQSSQTRCRGGGGGERTSRGQPTESFR
jgi:hypothetical protein